jgi:hypothetical protein
MAAAKWTPPDNPNPTSILHSAVDDVRNGLNDRALAKFLWFHGNALRYESAMYGVRLSFDLASSYAPAMEAFIRVRDETELNFRNDPIFQDLAALNDRLEDGNRTARLFTEVATNNREAASRVYRVAEPYLIADGQFRACGPFLDSRVRLKLAADSYRIVRELEDSRAADALPVPTSARRHYIRNVATLAALLALNDRNDEARMVYDESLESVDDDEFRATMDEALTGHLPTSD